VKKQTHKVTKKDLGHTFILVVNATNAAGTTQAISAPTDTVTLLPKRKRGRHIVGTNGPNYLAGGAFDDVIVGNGGNDTIKGGAGNDRLLGGPGDDVIDGGPGSDTIDGGPGSDTIFAADGAKDVVDCGPGQDRVVADPDDVLKNCESVTYASSGSGSTSP
jgi:Ca2+-binding RTX toxin-like protein